MEKIVVNKSVKPESLLSGEDISQCLKAGMDNLKMAFFDLEKGGVNYKNMKGSKAFKQYQETATSLASFDFNTLSTRESLLAFWINIYNALVVHGILDLDIKESVKEISSFF